MKRVLFKILIPLTAIGLWMLTCYYWSNTEAGLDYFKYWICCGFPFGLRRMWLWLIPKGFGIQGIAVVAVNFIVAGIIGGFVVIFHLAKIFYEIVRLCIYLITSGRVLMPVKE